MSGNRMMMAETMAPRKALTATPARRRVAMEKWPPTAAIPYTRKVASQGAHESECREGEEEQARCARRDGDDCADGTAGLRRR